MTTTIGVSTVKRLLPGATCVLFAACGTSEISPRPATYHGDVAPIFAAKCQGCHQADGIAPFALDGFEAASAFAIPIRAAVNARTMPPWPPSDECREYAHDRSLSAEQIDAITRWVDAGAPAGDPRDARPAAAEMQTLERADLVLKLPAPYTPRLQPDEYRCFVLDWTLESDVYVVGYEGRPDNGRSVHHMIAYLAPPEAVARFEALDVADAELGYSCFGGPNGDAPSTPAPWLGGWTPGARPVRLPAGLGMKVRPGSKVVLQIHYNTISGLDPDQSELAYMLAGHVEKEATLIPFTNPEWPRERTMNIAPGDRTAMHEFTGDPAFIALRVLGERFQIGRPITVWSAILHMHTRGTRARLEVVRDTSRECLLDIPRWNFHWQGAYELAESTVIEPGERARIECHWDNVEDRELNWGEGTDDEMCLGGLLISQ